ncbi:MAG: AAA family ATPase, partial [Deinococcota bacterium]|nr:AAA family ATPase [Deinococcota bacterium]
MSGQVTNGQVTNGQVTDGLTWRRLELTGFGVHDGCKFEFPEGLAAYVAPNENGKSTAVAGLTAVVFGLPGVSDKTAWGQARYRSTRGLSRFEGSVEFLALDGQVYRVWRNFATHQVRLARLENGSYTTVFDGEHNPAARKGAPQYEEHLRLLVGISSNEVFNHTFSICQPLAWGGALSNEVATLLSGSGGGSYH